MKHKSLFYSIKMIGVANTNHLKLNFYYDKLLKLSFVIRKTVSKYNYLFNKSSSFFIEYKNSRFLGYLKHMLFFKFAYNFLALLVLLLNQTSLYLAKLKTWKTINILKCVENHIRKIKFTWDLGCLFYIDNFASISMYIFDRFKNNTETCVISDSV